MPSPNDMAQMQMAPEGAEGGAPTMAPEEAMQIIQELRIPQDMLPRLAMAIDALESAGMLPVDEPQEAVPARGALDTAIDAAKTKVMGGGQAAPY